MIPFFQLCPETARRETRTIIVSGKPPIPNGDYGFVEFYCDQPSCDCRRVLIVVMSKDFGPVATVNYGWESLDFYKRWDASYESEYLTPFLDPLGDQETYAPELLDIFTEILTNDSEYAARLPRHYQEFGSRIPAQTLSMRPKPSPPRRKLKPTAYLPFSR